MLIVADGSISKTFDPATRGLMMLVYIFTPFIGPRFGYGSRIIFSSDKHASLTTSVKPILGAYAISQQN